MKSWAWNLLAFLWAAGVRRRTRSVVRHIVLARPEANLGDCCEHLRCCGCGGVHALPLIHGALVVRADTAALTAAHRHSGIHAIEEDVWIPLRSVKTAAISDVPRQRLQEIPWGVSRIGAPTAWTVSRGAGVRVAVIDTGVDIDHPDLAANLRGGINILEPEQPPTDDNGHGTHVSGTIAAADNAVDVAGVAPACDLYAVKAFDAAGGAGVSDVLLSLQWCADYGMHVINMSFGQDEPSEALRRAIQGLERRGIILVAASGNGGAGFVSYPAKYPEVLAVASTNARDRLTHSSNLGPEVDLAAPGHRILSLGRGGGTRLLSGTSMAAPHVTGAVALVWAQRPQLNAAGVRRLLRDTAVPLPGGLSGLGGAGLVRVDRALGL